MASPGKSAHPPQRGMVHISTVFLAGIAGLLLGLFLGAAFFADSAGGPQRAQQTQQAPQGPTAEAAEHIARHEANVAERPEDADEWIALGNLYYDAGDPRNAVRAYDRALALRPDSPDVLTDKGTMHRALGQAAEALAAYERAIALAPRHQNAWFNKGVVLRDLGREEEAFAAWRGVVYSNPQATVPGSGQLLRDVLSRAGEL
jgi:cytochrome c-type biogenesis protein CcmH/NrfG